MAMAKEDEQLALLREILAELRRLNANLEKREQAKTRENEGAGTEDDDGEDDSEELEYFE